MIFQKSKKSLMAAKQITLPIPKVRPPKDKELPRFKNVMFCGEEAKRESEDPPRSRLHANLSREVQEEQMTMTQLLFMAKDK